MQSFDKYTDLQLIGQGSFGQVYKATDTNLGRTVAIKFVRPWPSLDAQAAQRFAKEGRRMAGIEHPNIVTVYDVGRTPDEQRPYIVMEWIDGFTLAEHLDTQIGGRLTPAQALPILRQTAQALAAAHEQGILHRDVKPGNLFITRKDGRTKLGDFGLAKVVDANSAKNSSAGSIVGSSGYIAPEALKGIYSERSDVYALGMVLYRMLAGKDRHHGDKPLHQINRAVSPALTALINNATAEDPATRPVSAVAFAAAVEATLTKPFFTRPLGMAVAVLAVAILAWVGVRTLYPGPAQPTPAPTATLVVAVVPPTATETPSSDPTDMPTPDLTVTAQAEETRIRAQAIMLLTEEAATPATETPTKTATAVPTDAPTVAPSATPSATVNAPATATAEAIIRQTAIAATLTALPTNTPTRTPPPLPTKTPTIAVTPTPLPDALINADTLNLRSGPSTAYPVLGSYPRDTALTVVGKNSSATWLQVRTSGNQNGWMSAGLLTVNVDLATVPVVAAPPLPPTSTPVATSTSVRPTPIPSTPTAEPTSPPSSK